ncbi:YtrH family sporulation protein [Natranaerobius trueperi]|uniref:Sporulation protein n=1 Tax=Natranaerobius trueperi TaxID=759412 RepID=A0A226C0D6_9FIRM|nr:YtrH family sporulation protein [Natranaerobius trueperi]OWZ84696.1 sporulation protein [Natranaerobius trueperi]
MTTFFSTLILNFFIALGVVIGGSLIGSLGAGIGGKPPLQTMMNIAERLKIWALVAALGGTFTTIKELEMGFLGGQLHTVIKQLIFIFAAFLGAHIGVIIITLLIGGQNS